MTEASMLWATGTTGDGAVAGFSQDYSTGLFHRTLINDLTAEGPLKNYLNELAISATNHAVTPYVTRATGGAWVYGFHYWDTAALNLNITLPVVNDTGFRVVLRATYGATRTVRVALLESADGVSAIPAVTQTLGTLWEISLASGVVDTSGDIWTTAGKTVAGVTDLREFVHPNIEVEPAMVADRTRTMWVDAIVGRNVTDGTDIFWDPNMGSTNNKAGLELPDSKSCYGIGQTIVPSDFASDMSATAVIFITGTGTPDVFGLLSSRGGACGESFNKHVTLGGAGAAVTITGNQRDCIMEIDTGLSKGDMVQLRFVRDGTDVSDTVGASVWLLGFVVTYTADS